MKRVALFALLSCGNLIPLEVLAAELVTQCGQTVTGPAVLGADLDCSAAADSAIHLMDSSLDLQGHSLAANIVCERPYPLGRKQGGCVIRGPGSIHGCVTSLQSVQIHAVTLSERDGLCSKLPHYPVGVGVSGTIVLVTDSDISGYPSGCVASPYEWRGGGNVTILNSTLSDCETDSAGGAPALAGLREVRVLNSTIDGGIIAGRRAYLRESNVSGIGTIYPGVRMVRDDNSVLLVDSLIAGMGTFGIDGGRIRMKRSEVTGNCLSTGDCVDIRAEVGVKLSESTCGTSVCVTTGQSCGVCTGD